MRVAGPQPLEYQYKYLCMGRSKPIGVGGIVVSIAPSRGCPRFDYRPPQEADTPKQAQYLQECGHT